MLHKGVCIYSANAISVCEQILSLDFVVESDILISTFQTESWPDFGDAGKRLKGQQKTSSASKNQYLQ